MPALHQIEATFRNARAAGRGESGKIRIGLLTTLGGGFLRHVIASFREDYRNVDLVLHEGGRRDHLSRIRSRHLDIAFLTGSSPLPSVDLLELWHERVHVALPCTHPLAARCSLDWVDIRGEQFLVSAREPGPEVHDFIIRRAASYSTYPNVRIENVSQETLMHMVAIGAGMTVVSEGWTHTAYPELVLKPLTAREDIVPMSAVWSPDNDNPALRRFISFARSRAANPILKAAAD